MRDEGVGAAAVCAESFAIRYRFGRRRCRRCFPRRPHLRWVQKKYCLKFQWKRRLVLELVASEQAADLVAHLPEELNDCARLGDLKHKGAAQRSWAQNCSVDTAMGWENIQSFRAQQAEEACLKEACWSG